MRLRFFQDATELTIKTERDLVRKVIFNQHRIILYLNNFRIGRLAVEKGFSAVKPQYVFFTEGGLGSMIPLKLQFEEFVKFLDREDITLEAFFASSVRIENVCLLQEAMEEEMTPEKKEDFFKNVRDLMEAENFAHVKYFKEQVRPFSSQFRNVQFSILFNTKRF